MKGIEQRSITRGNHPGFRVEIHQSVIPYVGQEEVFIPTHPDRQQPAERNLTKRKRRELKRGTQNPIAIEVPNQVSVEPITVFSDRWPRNITAITLGPSA